MTGANHPVQSMSEKVTSKTILNISNEIRTRHSKMVRALGLQFD